MKAKLAFGIVLSALVLNGCQRNITYSYLMQHPNFLQQESLRCSITEQVVKEDAEYCKLVERAATDLMSVATSQQSEPEKFGMRIMEVEAEYVNVSFTMNKARQAIHQAKQNRDKLALLAAETRFEQARKHRNEKEEELAILFAVLRAHSPE